MEETPIPIYLIGFRKIYQIYTSHKEGIGNTKRLSSSNLHQKMFHSLNAYVFYNWKLSIISSRLLNTNYNIFLIDIL